MSANSDELQTILQKDDVLVAPQETDKPYVAESLDQTPKEKQTWRIWHYSALWCALRYKLFFF